MAIRVSVDGEVVRVVWHGEPDDASLRAYFDRILEVARSVERYAIVYDFRRAELPSSSRRRMLATLTRQLPDDVRTNCVGVAFVIASAAIRGALTVVLWFQPMSLDHVVVDSIEEADAWVEGRLRHAPRASG